MKRKPFSFPILKEACKTAEEKIHQPSSSVNTDHEAALKDLSMLSKGMVEDWDYVSMDTYSKDTKELAEKSSNAIRVIKKERDRLEDILYSIVARYGEVRFSLVDKGDYVMVQYVDSVDCDVVLKAKRKENE